MRFEGKSVLITGAAVGIGRAAAVKFAKEGANVVAWDLNEEYLNSLQQELSALGAKSLMQVCDVSDENAVNTMFAETKARFGKIDILVNNAALWRCWRSFMDTSVEEWKRFFDVNVMGVVYCTRAVLPDMIEAGYGRIVNIASVAGVYGNANMVHYSATKGAILSMTQGLAKEVADKGIRVNAVSPGTVTSSKHHDYELTLENEANYMGRTGSDRENAELICFLASDEAAYISGQNIQIDGCRKKI